MAWQKQDYPNDLIAEGNQARQARGKQVWVTTGRTESGDTIGPYAWGFEPTDDEVECRLREDWPEEYEYVGFVHHSTSAATVKER